MESHNSNPYTLSLLGAHHTGDAHCRRCRDGDGCRDTRNCRRCHTGDEEAGAATSGYGSAAGGGSGAERPRGDITRRIKLLEMELLALGSSKDREEVRNSKQAHNAVMEKRWKYFIESELELDEAWRRQNFRRGDDVWRHHNSDTTSWLAKGATTSWAQASRLAVERATERVLAGVQRAHDKRKVAEQRAHDSRVRQTHLNILGIDT